MRVISGSARGLKLKSPKDINTRPTTDRLKESLFNMIAFDIPNCRFLDIFSGSGAIGIEALSRGAISCTFIENDAENIALIKDNVSSAKFLHKANIYHIDAINEIDFLKDKFDIIFLDPPYNKGLLLPVLKKIESLNLLSEDGFIICEQHTKEPEIILNNLETYKVKKYKTTKFSFLKRI